jgi:hypothetical protein
MILRVRTFAPFFRSLAFLFLAFAVFNWSLNARLYPFKSPLTQNSAAAKSSTQKHSTRTLKALEQRETSDDNSDQFIFTAVLNGVATRPISRPVAHEAELRLLHPGRIDLRGIYSLHRPPPSLL